MSNSVADISRQFICVVEIFSRLEYFEQAGFLGPSGHPQPFTMKSLVCPFPVLHLPLVQKINFSFVFVSSALTSTARSTFCWKNEQSAVCEIRLNSQVTSGVH